MGDGTSRLWKIKDPGDSHSVDGVAVGHSRCISNAWLRKVEDPGDGHSVYGVVTGGHIIGRTDRVGKLVSADQPESVVGRASRSGIC